MALVAVAGRRDTYTVYEVVLLTYLLLTYAGAIDYRDIDLDHVEGGGLDSIATLAQLTTAL